MPSLQPSVQAAPPAQSNPFAKHLAEHVNAGAVAIESERAIAEAQGKLVIAKRFPRDQARAYANIIDACKRPGLAEEACYSFPRGGQTVSGPSIRLAEMLAANWGNIDYGIRELSRKDGVSEMEAYCWDLETNTMSSQKFTVRHIRDTRSGGVKLTDERDIYELTANMGGRRLRARILAILPADLVQASVDECGKTLAGSNDLPLADRVRNAVAAFKTLGVSPDLIEKRLGHKLDVVTPDELGDLRKIHNSIRDGISKRDDWFGDKVADDDGIDGDPKPDRPAPPKRAPKGAAAVLQNPAPKPVEVVVPAEPVKEPEPAAPAETAPQVEPAPVTEPAKPRAFLTDGEELTTEVKVLEVKGGSMASNNVKYPSVRARVSGGFNGDVYHINGAKVEGEQTVPLPPWKTGASLVVKLKGIKNDKGEVKAYVESVEAAPEVF